MFMSFCNAKWHLIDSFLFPNSIFHWRKFRSWGSVPSGDHIKNGSLDINYRILGRREGAKSPPEEISGRFYGRWSIMNDSEPMYIKCSGKKFSSAPPSQLWQEAYICVIETHKWCERKCIGTDKYSQATYIHLFLVIKFPAGYIPHYYKILHRLFLWLQIKFFISTTNAVQEHVLIRQTIFVCLFYYVT